MSRPERVFQTDASSAVVIAALVRTTEQLRWQVAYRYDDRVIVKEQFVIWREWQAHMDLLIEPVDDGTAVRIVGFTVGRRPISPRYLGARVDKFIKRLKLNTERIAAHICVTSTRRPFDVNPALLALNHLNEEGLMTESEIEDARRNFLGPDGTA